MVLVSVYVDTVPQTTDNEDVQTVDRLHIFVIDFVGDGHKVLLLSACPHFGF